MSSRTILNTHMGTHGILNAHTHMGTHGILNAHTHTHATAKILVQQNHSKCACTHTHTHMGIPTQNGHNSKSTTLTLTDHEWGARWRKTATWKGKYGRSVVLEKEVSWGWIWTSPEGGSFREEGEGPSTGTGRRWKRRGNWQWKVWSATSLRVLSCGQTMPWQLNLLCDNKSPGYWNFWIFLEPGTTQPANHSACSPPSH